MSIKHLYSIAKTWKNYWLFFAILTAFSTSCKKDTLLTDSSAKLSFSTNELDFDTVFTTIGSTVQAFEVRNTHNQAINISSIQLAGSYTSPFKINVDGTPGTSFSNIKIPANDSIFIFVTVTINPNNKNNPIVIYDSLIFTTNGNIQSVRLEAWGQDAHFFKPNVFPAQGPAYSVLPCSMSTWTNDKPYVIYGYLVDSCGLTIEPGTMVYMHGNGSLYVNSGATLHIDGSPQTPVVFQGDRLETAYQTVPGQWGEIQLAPGSINNTISWALIKNGTIGVEADTLGASSYPTLRIDHTIIKSMSEFGLLGQGATIEGDDLLVEDCQYYCVDLGIGGGYRFNQCTFANYWSYGQRQTSLLNINNYYLDVNNHLQSRNMDSANFFNCIVYGSQSQEVNIDRSGSGSFNYFFSNCILQTTTSVTNGHSTGCKYNYPEFNDTLEPPADDYHVSPSSPALHMGSVIWGIYPVDLDNNMRQYTSGSTVGTYEQ